MRKALLLSAKLSWREECRACGWAGEGGWVGGWCVVLCGGVSTRSEELMSGSGGQGMREGSGMEWR